MVRTDHVHPRYLHGHLTRGAVGAAGRPRLGAWGVVGLAVPEGGGDSEPAPGREKKREAPSRGYVGGGSGYHLFFPVAWVSEDPPDATREGERETIERWSVRAVFLGPAEANQRERRLQMHEHLMQMIMRSPGGKQELQQR